VRRSLYPDHADDLASDSAAGLRSVHLGNDVGTHRRHMADSNKQYVLTGIYKAMQLLACSLLRESMRILMQSSLAVDVIDPLKCDKLG